MLKLTRLHQKLNAIWYHDEPSILNTLLLPLSILFQTAVTLRQKLKRRFVQKNPVPVIVVGNLTVGGSGKTPAVIALIQMMQQKSQRPGVISRGYPINPTQPICVHATSNAKEVGDEALLIFQRTQVPVCVCRDRNLAIQVLAKQGVDIIFSDDGLQNFSFKHDIELVLYDKILQFGNQKMLPAGPLREPLSRLSQVDFLIEKQLITDNPSSDHSTPSWHSLKTVYPFTLQSTGFTRLSNWATQVKQSVTADYFRHKKVIAVTGIAHPESFFASLSSQGITHHKVMFCDHYTFTEQDFSDYVDCEIIMTEKDAVKCLNFCQNNFWCAPLVGTFSLAFQQAFDQMLKTI